MRKSISTLTIVAGLVVSAHATDLNGSDWNFNYQGHYSVANIDLSGLGLTSILGATLGTQLGLLNGTVSTSQGVSLNQSGATSLTTSSLSFDADRSSSLLPSVGTFLYNVLNANDGSYTGALNGSTLSLTKSPLVGAMVDGTSIIDTRVGGSGIVIDLRAALSTNSLVGTIDGVQSGSSLLFGPQGYHVKGTAGLTDTIGIQARVTTYVSIFGQSVSTSTGYINVGAIQTTADSWSLSRSPQAVPEPTSIAALGLGTLGFLRRRAKKA